MKRIVVAIAAVALAVFASSCGKVEQSAAGGKHKIGILAPAVTHGWVAAVELAAEKRCKELPDVEYKILTSSDAAEMTSQLDDLEAWGAKAIVTFPQWTGMEVPLAAAIQRGVHVVSFDIAVDVPGVYLVSGDNESMGVGSAKYLFEKLGPEATIAVMPVPISGSVSALRVKGFMDTYPTLAPNWKIVEQATKFTREAGLTDFADVLMANPHIDGVFSIDDETSIGILQAIQEAGRTDIKVVTGGGGCQEYFKMMPENKDIWIQSALYSPNMVVEAVNAAYGLLTGAEVQRQLVIPTTIVDRDNCADFLDADSPY